MRDLPRRGSRWWQPLVGAVPLAILAWAVDWTRFAAVVERAQVSWILLVVVVLHADRVFMALKWMLLARGPAMSVSAGAALKSYYVSSFWGCLLPTSVGADVIRIYWLTRRGHDAASLTVSVIVERVLGALALAAAGLAALAVLLAVSGHVTAPPLAGGLLAFAAMAVLVTATLFSRTAYRLSAAVTRRMRWAGLQRVLATLGRSVDGYRRRRRLLATFFVLSVLHQVLPLASNFCVARALSIPIPLAWLIIGVPIVLAVSRVPLPLNDYGVKEGVYALVFSFAGVPLTEGVALAIVHRVLLLLALLPGAFWTMDVRRTLVTGATAPAAPPSGPSGP